MTSDAPAALSLRRRFEAMRRALGPLLIDVAVAEYLGFCIVYAFNHTREGRPESVPALWIGLVALAAFELGVLTSCLLDGVGPRLARVRLIDDETGRPPSAWQRLARFAAWNAAVVPTALALWFALRLAWGDHEREWLAIGVSAAGAIIAYYLSVLGSPTGRLWHERVSRTWFRSTVGASADETVLPWYREAVWWVGIAIVGVTYYMGWRIAEVNLPELATGMGPARQLAGALVTPKLDILGECAWAMVETIYLALMATTFAVPIAIVLSFFGARNIMPRTVVGTTVYVLMRAFFTVTRSIEPIVWAIIFVVWVGLGPFAGMMALLVHSVAALGKLYSEQVESIDPGPVEAIKATGAGPVHTIVYAVWPQVVPPFVAFTLYRWDINVRMATIVGLVGGGGIGFLLFQYQQMLQWREVALIVWIITLVVWLMDAASATIRQRLG